MLNIKDIKTEIANAAHIQELVAHINSAYRGESSRRGWTTEADILEGIRINEPGVQEIIDESNADLHIFRMPGNELAACVYLKEGEDYLYLGMLTVKPSMQAVGLGKYILSYAENLARTKGKKRIRMTVINTRTELIAWYNRHGYLPTGEIEPWIDGVHIGNRKADFAFLVLEKPIG